MHRHLEELEKFVMAGIPAIWLTTHEERRTMALMADFKNDLAYTVIEWDILNAARITYANGRPGIKEDELKSLDDPVAAIKHFTELTAQGVIMILHDFHRFIKSAEIVRAIKTFLAKDQPLKHLIFMSHANSIPEELEKDVLLAHVSLPDKSDLQGIVESILSDNDLTESVMIEAEHVKAVMGLTQQEASNAFALTLAKKECLNREELEAFKLEAVKKSGMMEIFPAVAESELGGLDSLKEYMRLRSKGFDDEGLPTPTGILLMGLPGGGKSLSAKVIASMLKMPLIKLDIASLKSKYVGESESKMGQALNLIDAVSPAVVWLDK